PVKGKVVLGSAPLTTGTVVFHADQQEGNATLHEPRGAIDAEGNFEVMTAGKKGAPAGRYKVTILAQKKPITPGDPYARLEWLVAKEYTSPATTPLTLEVVEKPSEGTYDLTVK